MEWADWWVDWWANHSACKLSSEAECTAQRVTTAKKRLDRDAAIDKINKIDAYRSDAWRKLRRCEQNGWGVCYVGRIYSWTPNDADETRAKLLADMRRLGYNCMLDTEVHVDISLGFTSSYDVVVCDLVNPLPARENSDA